jgi:prefoldin subunit 5
MTDDETGPLGYNLEELRRKALNREIRRRRGNAPLRFSSKRVMAMGDEQEKRAGRSKTHAEIRKTRRSKTGFRPDSPSRVLANHIVIEALNESSSSLLSTSSALNKRDQLGEQALNTINVQKQSIAELRPARRRIKWNSAICDWERKSELKQLQPNCRLSSLQLKDLNIPGSHLNFNEKTERIATVISPYHRLQDKIGGNSSIELCANHIKELEDRLRECFHDVRRYQREAEEVRHQCALLEHENSTMRMQLASMNAPARRTSLVHSPSLDQVTTSLDQLKEKLSKLDEEIGMIKMQKRSLDADSRIWLELLESTSVDRETVELRSGSRLDGSISTAEESDIKSMLTRDISFEDTDLYSLDMAC